MLLLATQKVIYDSAVSWEQLSFVKWDGVISMSKALGRNDPCTCGSGKKYKHCCLIEEIGIDTRVGGYMADYEAKAKTTKVKQCIHPDKSQCSG